MYVKQRIDKQYLQCESCKEWKDDRFCDWKTYSELELVICSKCGQREATRENKNNIKVYTQKIIHGKQGISNDKHIQNNTRNKQSSMF